MSSNNGFFIPETKVLSISSHVVYGYVGNTMATLIMQSLGCEVAAINTVQLSNHLGYGHARGSRASPSFEILEIWTGLKEAVVNNFDMLLTGYLPDEASIESVLHIVNESRQSQRKDIGNSLFWVLDPIMGDNGKLYMSENIIPVYKRMVQHADLIIPNHFEAEILSEVKIVDVETLRLAFSTLHSRHEISHIIITSLKLAPLDHDNSLFVAGSTIKSTKTPRIFIIKVPQIDCFFSGTGDMFAALILVRLREAVHETPGLAEIRHWLSNDNVKSIDLPLAKATEKACASLHEILTLTKRRRDMEMTAYYEKVGGVKAADVNVSASRNHKAALARAAEVRVLRNVQLLKFPGEKFTAVQI